MLPAVVTPSRFRPRASSGRTDCTHRAYRDSRSRERALAQQCSLLGVGFRDAQRARIDTRPRAPRHFSRGAAHPACQSRATSNLDLALYEDGVQSQRGVRVLTYAARRICVESLPVRARALPRIVQSEQPERTGFLATALQFECIPLRTVVMNTDACNPVALEPLRSALSAAAAVARLRG
jgi:hypothetical protein